MQQLRRVAAGLRGERVAGMDVSELFSRKAQGLTPQKPASVTMAWEVPEADEEDQSEGVRRSDDTRLDAQIATAAKARAAQVREAAMAEREDRLELLEEDEDELPMDEGDEGAGDGYYSHANRSRGAAARQALSFNDQMVLAGEGEGMLEGEVSARSNFVTGGDAVPEIAVTGDGGEPIGARSERETNGVAEVVEFQREEGRNKEHKKKRRRGREGEREAEVEAESQHEHEHRRDSTTPAEKKRWPSRYKEIYREIHPGSMLENGVNGTSHHGETDRDIGAGRVLENGVNGVHHHESWKNRKHEKSHRELHHGKSPKRDRAAPEASTPPRPRTRRRLRGAKKRSGNGGKDGQETTSTGGEVAFF